MMNEIPKFRAFHKENRLMGMVDMLDHTNERITFTTDGVFVQVPFTHCILMMNSGRIWHKHGASVHEAGIYTYSVYVGDILKILYENPVTHEVREAFGVVDYKDGCFCIDFPQHGSWYGIPDDEKDCMLYGNCWQPETWGGVCDEELVSLMIQWLKDEGIEYPI